MGSHRTRNVVIGALALVGLLNCPARNSILWAQVSPRQQSEVARVLMLAPREYQQLLKQAERALEADQYSEAIDHLGQLLHNQELPDEPSLNEDFFVGRAGQNHYQSSLRGQARKLLGSMPREGRELYELQFGAEARRLLQLAAAERDLSGLSDVSRKYFHTRAGYAATMLLGRIYLDLGRPMAAAMCFSRLADNDDATTQYDPELSLLLAGSWRLAGMTDKATEVLVDLRERIPRAEFEVQGQSTRIFDDQQDPIAWLDSILRPITGLTSMITDEWHMHRGVSSRNAVTAGSLPLLRPSWRVQIANDPDDEEIIDALSTTFSEENTVSIPAISPLFSVQRHRTWYSGI